MPECEFKVLTIFLLTAGDGNIRWCKMAQNSADDARN